MWSWQELEKYKIVENFSYSRRVPSRNLISVGVKNAKKIIQQQKGNLSPSNRSKLNNRHSGKEENNRKMRMN